MDVPTDDLVCLTLETVEEPSETGPVPEIATVPGLTDALELGGQLSGRVELLTELEGLTESGFLRNEVRPVAGTDTERNAYLLTEAGRRRANRLRDRIRDKTVTVTNGTTAEIRLGEIDRYLEKPAIVRALVRLTDDRTVPLEEGRDTELVGRGAELDRLTGAAERIQAEGGRALLVTGETGVGKTTLVDEFVTKLADRHDPVVARAGCERDATRPYAVFRRAFAELPNATELQALFPTTPDPGDAPETIDQRRQTFFDAVTDEIRGLTAQRPLVFVFDDLQWADRASVDLLAHLVESLSQWMYPVLFVGTCRSGDDDTPVGAFERELRASDRHAIVELDPLDRIQTREIARQILDGHDLPDAFVETVHTHTDGNPLFVEETVRQLVERGAVQPAEGVFPTEERPLPTPETVTGTVDARLEALDGTGASIVGLGAVIGESIPRDVLVAASPLSEPELRDYVDLLVESQIWSRDGGSLEFVHGVVREAMLERLDEKRRQEFHGRVASAIESVSMADDQGKRDRRLATHYRESGQPGAAIDASLTAARRATEVYAHADAVEAARQALELAREDGDDGAVCEALELLGDTYVVTGEFESATRCFREGREAGDRSHRQRLYRKEGMVCQKQGAFEEARDHLERSLEMARELGDDAERAKCLQHLGFVAQEEGEFDRARETLTGSLETFRELDDRGNLAVTRRNLGNVALRTGAYDLARDHYQQSLETFRELQDRSGEAKTLGNLGLVERHEGNFETARRHLEESLTLLEELGDRYGQAVNLNNLAELVQREGDFEGAREYHERGLEIERELGNRHGVAVSLGNLGELAQRTGEFRAAREYHTESLEIHRELGDRHGEAVTLSNLAGVAHEEGRYDAARDQLTDALEISREIGDRHSEAACLYNLALLTADQGEHDRAHGHARESLDIFEELGDVEFAAEVRGFLGAIELRVGDVTAGRERLPEARTDAEQAGIVPTELRIIRYHLEAERELGNEDRARELCDKAWSCIERTDAGLGYEREQIEDICGALDEE